MCVSHEMCVDGIVATERVRCVRDTSQHEMHVHRSGEGVCMSVSKKFPPERVHE